MSIFILCLLSLFLSVPAFAADRAALDQRIRELTANLDVLQAKSETRMSPELLRNAQGIILLNRVKAGVVFGFQGGGGVAMAKDPNSGRWGAPMFLEAHEVSLGFQVGGQHSFVAILLMNTNAVRTLTQTTFKFGGQATGTAADASAATPPVLLSGANSVLIRTDTSGFYAGAVLGGDTLEPDTEANLVYYGQPFSIEDILLNKAPVPTGPALTLAQRLEQFSQWPSQQPGTTVGEKNIQAGR